MHDPDIWVTIDSPLPYSVEIYDLCDTCIEELKQWMNKYHRIKRYENENLGDKTLTQKLMEMEGK